METSWLPERMLLFFFFFYDPNDDETSQQMIRLFSKGFEYTNYHIRSSQSGGDCNSANKNKGKLKTGEIQLDVE